MLTSSRKDDLIRSIKYPATVVPGMLFGHLNELVLVMLDAYFMSLFYKLQLQLLHH